MLDLDFIDFNKKQFLNMFDVIKDNNNINGIFGMSIDQNNIYYDVGSLSPLIYTLDHIIVHNRLIKVDSFFSGFGVYKMTPIIDNNIIY